jgi:hypothetical protein
MQGIQTAKVQEVLHWVLKPGIIIKVEMLLPLVLMQGTLIKEVPQ